MEFWMNKLIVVSMDTQQEEFGYQDHTINISILQRLTDPRGQSLPYFVDLHYQIAVVVGPDQETSPARFDLPKKRRAGLSFLGTMIFNNGIRVHRPVPCRRCSRAGNLVRRFPAEALSDIQRHRSRAHG